jgi:hypothetical protein
VASSDEMNQCDGCRAGVPITWSSWTPNGKPIPLHRMGLAAYPDYMACQASKYQSPAPSKETHG